MLFSGTGAAIAVILRSIRLSHILCGPVFAPDMPVEVGKEHLFFFAHRNTAARSLARLVYQRSLSENFF